MNTGQIIKSKTTERYTTIPNEIIKSVGLSLDDKALLIYLLSLPCDWVLYKKNLHNVLPDKPSKINKAFKSLQIKGYIHSKKVHGDDGKFIGWNHIVYDVPENRESEIPKLAFTDVGEKAPILNTKLIQKPNKEKGFIPPTLQEVINFFIEKGSTSEIATTAFEYYNVADWKDGRGRQVKNWKQKMIAVWINKTNFKQQKKTDYEHRKDHFNSIVQWASTIE